MKNVSKFLKGGLWAIGIALAVVVFMGVSSTAAEAACTSDSATIQLPETAGAYSGTITAAWTPNGTFDTCVFDVEYRRAGDVGWTAIGSSAPGEATYDWNTVVATTARGDQTDYQFRVKLAAAQLAATGNFTLDNSAPVIAATNITDDGPSGIGDDIVFDVTVADAISGIASVTADLSDLGGPDDWALTDDEDGTWSGTYTLIAGTVDDPAKAITVTATNGSGLTDTDSDTVNVDNEAPTVTAGDITVTLTDVAGDADAYNIGDSVTVSWDGTDNADLAGATADLSDFGGDAAVVMEDDGAGGTCDDGGAGDGVYCATYTLAIPALDLLGDVSVTATDDAANVTTTAKGGSYEIDTTNPTNGAITATIDDAGTEVTNGDTITYTVDLSAETDTIASVTIDCTDIGDGAAVAMLDNGVAPDVTAADDIYTAQCTVFGLGVPAEGPQTSDVTTTDDAGNTDTDVSPAVTVDVTPPDVTQGNITTTITTDNLGAGVANPEDVITVVWLDGAGGDGNTDVISVTVDMSAFGCDDAVVAVEAPADTWTATCEVPVGDIDNAALAATVTATDDAGNFTATADDNTVSVDNEPPTITTPGTLAVTDNNVGGANAAVTDGVTYTGGTEGTGDVVTWTADLTDLTGDNAAASGVEDAVIAGSLDDTDWSATETVTDDAGNFVTGPTGVLDVDNEIPVVTAGGAVNISTDGGVIGVAAINDGVTPDELTYAGGTETTGDTITWTINYGAVLGYGGVENSDVALALQSGATDNAAQTFAITATDDAGNTDVGGTLSDAVSIDDIPPIITDIGTLAVTDNNVGGAGAAVTDGVTYTGGTVAADDDDVWTADLSDLTGDNPADSGTEYEVIAGDIDDANWDTTETVTDDAGNYITGTTDTLDVDNKIPVFTDVTANAAIYDEGDNVIITADMTENDTELPTVTVDLLVLDSTMSATTAMAEGVATIFSNTAVMLGGLTMSSDGSYVIEVTATDDAGNTVTDDSLSVDIFNDQPIVDGIEIAPNPITSISLATAHLHDDTAVTGARYNIYDSSNALIAGPTAIALPADGVWGGEDETANVSLWTIMSAQADGTYTIKFEAQDANGYGSVASKTFTKGDTTAPTITSVSPTTVQTDRTPDIAAVFDDAGWDGTDANNLVSFTLDGTSQAATADIDGTALTIAYTPGANIADKTWHVVYVEVKDLAGNIKQTTWTFYVNTTADDVTAPVFTAVLPTTVQTSGDVTISADVTEANTLTGYMTIDGVPVAATVDDEDAPAQVISFDAEGLSTGTHVVYIKGTDAAGNWNATSFNVIVNPNADDVTAPVFTAVLPTTVQTSGDVTISADVTEANTLTGYMTIDGVPVAATVDDEDAPAQVISFDAEGLSTGTHVVYVKGTDAAGNWNATSFNVIVNPDYDVVDPQVTGQIPLQGSEDVAIMIHPVITFSEDMDPATVNSSTVQLREYDTGNPLLYGQLIVYDQDTDTASIQPLAMDYDTHYYIWVSGAKDLAGNPVEDYTDPDVSDFTTLAYTTYTTDIPSVASFLPGAGEEIGVTVGPDGNIISVTFDTSMYEQSLTTDTIKLWKVGEEEDTEVTNTTLVLVNANGLSNNVVKIIPAANLDYESAYYLTVADDVRSFSTGENMADDYTSDTFSTRAEETGALGVNNAIQVRYWGVPNGGYNNGWEWVLNITVPSDNNNFAMKFADWISGSHTLLVAGNMRYWSEEINEGELGSETNPVEITAADEYPDYISLDSDANSSPDAHGLQTNIHVQVKIPAGQSGGSYSTSYGIEIPD